MIAEDLFKKIMRSKDDINDEDITEMLEEYYRCIRKQRDKYKLSRLDIQTIVVVPLPMPFNRRYNSGFERLRIT